MKTEEELQLKSQNTSLETCKENPTSVAGGHKKLRMRLKTYTNSRAVEKVEF